MIPLGLLTTESTTRGMEEKQPGRIGARDKRYLSGATPKTALLLRGHLCTALMATLAPLPCQV